MASAVIHLPPGFPSSPAWHKEGSVIAGDAILQTELEVLWDLSQILDFEIRRLPIYCLFVIKDMSESFPKHSFLKHDRGKSYSV